MRSLEPCATHGNGNGHAHVCSSAKCNASSAQQKVSSCPLGLASDPLLRAQGPSAPRPRQAPAARVPAGEAEEVGEGGGGGYRKIDRVCNSCHCCWSRRRFPSTNTLRQPLPVCTHLGPTPCPGKNTTTGTWGKQHRRRISWLLSFSYYPILWSDVAAVAGSSGMGAAAPRLLLLPSPQCSGLPCRAVTPCSLAC